MGLSKGGRAVTDCNDRPGHGGGERKELKEESWLFIRRAVTQQASESFYSKRGEQKERGGEGQRRKRSKVRKRKQIWKEERRRKEERGRKEGDGGH